MSTTQTLLDHRGSVLKTFHVDTTEEGRTIEVTEQNLEPLLEAVKRERETREQDPEMKLAALIPMAVVEQMMRDGSWNDEAAIKRWLNDPANDCFRVWRGKL